MFELNNPTKWLWSKEIKVYRQNLGLDRDIIIKRVNYEALSSFKPQHNDQGQRLCLNCGKVILDKRKKKYCSDKCSDDFFAKHNFARLRNRIFIRDNFTCKKCGKSATRHGRTDVPFSTYNYVVDHIKPIALGGPEFDENNLQLLCSVCNKEKTRNDQAKIAKKRSEIRLLRNPFEVPIGQIFVPTFPQQASLLSLLCFEDKLKV